MHSDRDYSYDELLQRVFGIMRDRNPDMVIITVIITVIILMIVLNNY